MPTLKTCSECPDKALKESQPVTAIMDGIDIRYERRLVRPDMSVDEMKDMIQGCAPGPWPDKWPWWENTKEAYRQLAREHADSIEPYHGQDKGRGVVIAGGGTRYFPGVWVCVRTLRELGCELPVEVWYMGDYEMDPAMKAVLGPYDVDFVDAKEVEKRHPIRILAGWELKPYSIKHSKFEEILFLDADNYPLVDPTFLFDHPDYTYFGATLWPDYDNWLLKPDVWDTFGIVKRHEPAIESGQVMVDKSRSWRELCMSLWYAEHSDYVFKHVYGDKECFHLGWRLLGSHYAMPGAKPAWNVHTIVQHDFAGNHLFHHRCQDKLKLDGSNRWLSGVAREERCKELLEELRAQWSGTLWHNNKHSENEAKVVSLLEGGSFLYRRVGYDERVVTFEKGGSIKLGAADCERRWEVHDMNGRIVLTVCGENRPTFHASEGADGVWRGEWLFAERMPVELVPVEIKEVGRGS